MILILLEALAAVLLVGAAVWWTMFAGRKKGERPSDEVSNGDDPSGTGHASDEQARPRDPGPPA